MRSLLVIVFVIFAAVGCGGSQGSPAPLSADQKQKMDEEMKAVEDQERGPAQPAKGKKR